MRHDVVVVAVLCFVLIFLIIIPKKKDYNPKHISSNRNSNDQIHIQCEDEHEPVVTTLPNTTEIVVTCEAK
jgi:hypothetical protein